MHAVVAIFNQPLHSSTFYSEMCFLFKMPEACVHHYLRSVALCQDGRWSPQSILRNVPADNSKHQWLAAV